MGCGVRSDILAVKSNVDEMIKGLDGKKSEIVGKHITGMFQLLLKGKYDPKAGASIKEFLSTSKLNDVMGDVNTFIGSFINPSVKWKGMTQVEMAKHINNLKEGEKDTLFWLVSDYARQLSSFVTNNELKRISTMEWEPKNEDFTIGQDFSDLAFRETKKQRAKLSVGNATAKVCNVVGVGAKYLHHMFEQAPGVSVAFADHNSLLMYAQGVSRIKENAYTNIISYVNDKASYAMVDRNNAIDVVNRLMEYADDRVYEGQWEKALINKCKLDPVAQKNIEFYVDLVKGVKDLWFKAYYGDNYAKGIKDGDWSEVKPEDGSIMHYERQLGKEYTAAVCRYLNEYGGTMDDLSEGEVKTVMAFINDVNKPVAEPVMKWIADKEPLLKTEKFKHKEALVEYLSSGGLPYFYWAIKGKNRTAYLPYSNEKLYKSGDLQFNLIDLNVQRTNTGEFLTRIKGDISSAEYKSNTMLVELRAKSLISMTSNPNSKYYDTFMNWLEADLDKDITGTGSKLIDTVDKLVRVSYVQRETLNDPVAMTYDNIKNASGIITGIHEQLDADSNAGKDAEIDRLCKAIVNNAGGLVERVDGVIGKRNVFSKRYNKGEDYITWITNTGKSVNDEFSEAESYNTQLFSDLIQHIGGKQEFANKLSDIQISAIHKAGYVIDTIVKKPSGIRLEAITGAQNTIKILTRSFASELIPEQLLKLTNLSDKDPGKVGSAEVDEALSIVQPLCKQYTKLDRQETALMLQRTANMLKFIKAQNSSDKKSQAAFNNDARFFSSMFKFGVTSMLSTSGIVNKLAARSTALMSSTRAQIKQACKDAERFERVVDRDVLLVMDDFTKSLTDGQYKDLDAMSERSKNDAIVGKVAANTAVILDEFSDRFMNQGILGGPLTAYDHTVGRLVNKGYKKTEVGDWFTKNMTMASEGHGMVRGYIRNYLLVQYEMAEKVAIGMSKKGSLTANQKYALAQKVINDNRTRMVRFNDQLFGRFDTEAKHPMSWLSTLSPESRLGVILGVAKSSMFVFKHALTFSTIKTAEGFTNLTYGLCESYKHGGRKQILPVSGIAVMLVLEMLRRYMDHVADDKELNGTFAQKSASNISGVLSSTALRGINPAAYSENAYATLLACCKLMLGSQLTKSEQDYLEYSYGRAMGPMFGNVTSNALSQAAGNLKLTEMDLDYEVKEYMKNKQMLSNFRDTKINKFMVPFLRDFSSPGDVVYDFAVTAAGIISDVRTPNEMYTKELITTEDMNSQAPYGFIFGKENDNVAFWMNMMQLGEGLSNSVSAMGGVSKGSYASFNTRKFWQLVQKVSGFSSYRRKQILTTSAEINTTIEYLRQQQVLHFSEDRDILLKELKEFLPERVKEEQVGKYESKKHSFEMKKEKWLKEQEDKLK